MHKPIENKVGPETFEGAASIYIHIPFCRTKCPYCSFVSYPGKNNDFIVRYMQTLVQQAEDMAAHPWTRARQFISLYVGGGTPSTVDSEVMADFIERCLAEFDFTSTEEQYPEVTMEVNPKTVNREMLRRLKQAGVNRLSIGVQSFSDTMLRLLGREHTAQDCFEVVGLARDADFKNISLDLMYGLPGQDLATWKNSLQAAVGLHPEHLSVYELTIEEGTPFAEQVSLGSLDIPGEGAVLAMYESARETLSESGYTQYEISNYARKGFRSIHNINYWENGSYIGLGCGAFSCFSGVRIQNDEDPERFMKKLMIKQKPYKDGEFLPLEARFRESVVMGLRMTEGVSIARLRRRYGITPGRYYGKTLKDLIEQGLLEEKHNMLRLTKRGMTLANRIMARLV
ncbi:MAG: radical SAM family heme chaperone HemW [Deltaproteobacteria bacterium]|jgi:oxygen-independent coproporphyrinogen-3 oxidase|nr:radical SAM family heme chaperone HemW [Deltaproteobacteria bacterium]